MKVRGRAHLPRGMTGAGGGSADTSKNENKNEEDAVEE